MRAAAALVAAAAATLASASWTTLGTSNFRTNQVDLALPGEDTGITTASYAPFSDNSTMLPPLAVSQSDNVYTILASAACEVVVVDDTQAVVASWSGCSPADATVAAPLSLDPSGSTAVLVTAATGTVYAFSARVLMDFGSPLWAPVTIGEPVAASPLIMPQHAWLVGATTGKIYQLDMANNGSLVRTYAPTCSGSVDAVRAPLALLSATIGEYTVTAVTASGCVFAWRDTGVQAWNATIPRDPIAANASAPITIAPVVDNSLQHVYFATNAGDVCCVTFAGKKCSLWSTECAHLAPPAPLVQGLALGPANTAFHNGQLFAVDTAGNVYAVMTTIGMTVSSGNSLALGPVTAAPVVVPNAFGANLNVLLVATVDGHLFAIYVGDAPQPDDDNSSDDDSEGNDGIAWTIALVTNSSSLAVDGSGDGLAHSVFSPPRLPLVDGTRVSPVGAGGRRVTAVGSRAVAATAPAAVSTPVDEAMPPTPVLFQAASPAPESSTWRQLVDAGLAVLKNAADGRRQLARQPLQGPPVINCAAIAVRDDGRIIVPVSNGQVMVVGPQHTPKPDASYVIIIVVCTVVVLVIGAAIIATVWCAIRHRKRTEAALAAEQEQQQQPDQEGGIDTEPFLPAHYAPSVVSHHFDDPGVDGPVVHVVAVADSSMHSKLA